LDFQALCNKFIPDACRVEDFSALYMMRRIKEGGGFFVTRSSLEKLIVNLAGNDHGWRDTVIRVSGVWKTVVQKDCGVIPIAWNKGVL